MSNETVFQNGMTQTIEALPPIVSRAEWQQARDALLVKEKAATRNSDRLAAERRRLPMVEIDKQYVFDGPKGPTTLLEMFEGRRQLVIYHFMFHPDWTEGCVGCSSAIDNMGHPAHLHARNTTLAVVARAPLATAMPFVERMGWTLPWYSSFESDFNFDFDMSSETGESHGLSVFLREGERIFHTYFTGARGVESLGSTFSLLDLTPWGRQEEWEDSPAGWPQSPTYGWSRHHDRYDQYDASNREAIDLQA